MLVGGRVTVGAVRRLGVVGVAVVVLASVGFAGVAEAARAPRPTAGATGSACGRSAAVRASARSRAVAADISPFDIAKWVGEKTAGGAAGAVGGLAFNELLKLTGLKEKLEGRDPILVQLDQIEKQLEGVNARLDAISEQIDKLTAEFRIEKVNTDLGVLCPKVAQLGDLYDNHFIHAVEAGVALGKILTINPNDAGTLIGSLPVDMKKLYPAAGDEVCPDPVKPNPNLLVCNTPRELVNLRLDQFRDTFRHYEVNLAPGLFFSYLTVHTTPASIMTHYGQYLMTSRTLNHNDSEKLRDIYHQFAQAQALASWMSMEFYSVTTANGTTAAGVLDTYKKDTSAQEQQLPPMIPQGDVIDLGQKNASSTRNQPIWTLATTKDETFWPVNVESNNAVTTTADGAGNAVKALNNRACDPGAVCFTHWRIPSTVDLKALLSNTCQVTGNPPQLPKGCTPFVPSADNPNVGNYLARLDRGDSDWNEVFCRGSGAPACVAPADQHTFIWTTDTRRHTTNCAFHHSLIAGDQVTHARIYALRAGLPLKFITSPFSFTSLNLAWPIYPIMKDHIPDYGDWAAAIAYAKCDQYAREQLALATNKGIVLVTDNTGDVDFMAQPKAGNGLSEVRKARASLTAVPARCVRAPFTARLRGRFIKSVRWMLDGRRIAGRSARRGRRYAASIHVSPGRHTLTVRVKFVASAHTRARTFHRTVLGCRSAIPPVTG